MALAASRLGARSRWLTLLILVTCALLMLAAPAKSSADPSTRVIHGTVVPNNPAAWPFIVALVDADGHNFCGGTLIAAYWVVTAAHCDEVDSVIYGRKSLSNTAAGEKIHVAEQVINTSFNGANLANDIQLLRLAHPPADLHTAQLATPAEDPIGGELAQLAGWGITENSGGDVVTDLREASLDIYSNSSCGIQWGTLGITIFTTQICAAHWGATSADDRQACNGDSGGPLIRTTGGGDRLIGLTSFGRPGCDGYPFPNVYTRVSSFSAWAHSFMDNRISFDDARIDFGTTQAGGPGIPRAVTVRNTGIQPATVGGLTTTGSTDFKVIDNPCNGVTLTTTQSCNATIMYMPNSQGLTTGQLNVQFGGATSTIDISSYGILGSGAPTIAPKLTLSQAGKGVAAKGKLKVVLKGSFAIPGNVNSTTACVNNLLLTADIPGVKKSLKTQGAAKWSLGRCTAKLTLKMPRKAKRKRVKFTLRFAGNKTLATAEKTFKIRVK